MTDNFKSLNISDTLTEALSKQEITTPTAIQAMVIPRVIEKADVIAQSETGSGKTLAYLLPIFERFNEVNNQLQAIILVPTHELAIQVIRQAELLANNSLYKLKAQPLIGNVNIKNQIEKLKEKPQIVVGSPGRILELIKLKKLPAHTVKTIVIDEADKMLDKNNYDSVAAVIKCTQKDRQILLFSASVTDKTIDSAKGIMNNPELIRSQSKPTVPQGIEHIFVYAEQRDKIEALRKLVSILKPNKAMVFVNQGLENEKAVLKLRHHQYNAQGLHGSDDKLKRKKVIEDFKAGKLQLLITSDIASRGLHIDNIDCIFNLSMPEDYMDYLHRAGRTGRNNNPGLVVSIITGREAELIKGYKNKFELDIRGMEMYKGKLYALGNRK